MPKVKEQQTQSKFWYEMLAILLFGAGLLSFLALISFDPGDLRSIKDPPNNPPSNFIGAGGALFSGTCFYMVGLGSHFIPLIMFGVAGLIVFKPELPSLWFTRRILLTVLFLLSVSVLLQLAQPMVGAFLENPYEAGRSNQRMLGGMIGYVINDLFLADKLGPAGSGIIMGLLSLTSFIFLFNIHPVELIRLGWKTYCEWRERREEELLENADPLERLEYEKKKIERQHRALEKKLSETPLPKTTTPPATKINRPEPKVVDTTIAEPIKPAKTEKEPKVEKNAPKISGIEPEKAPAPKNKTEPAKPASAPLPAPSASAPADYSNYRLPSIDLLTANDGDGRVQVTEAELRAQQQLLIDTLAQFGIEVSPSDITRGATITRYEVYPAPGVRVERISSLQKDIARAMKAERINILAPVPGKDTVGVEVANSRKTKIVLRDLFESSDWNSNKAALPVALGKDVYGKVLVEDLAAMPHGLVGGTTGSGKSVCINCLLLSLLYKYTPEDLRIILVDPKVVELQVYNSLPHLVVPVVTDPKKVLLALRWVINEMEKRYRMMAKVGVRNIHSYNQHKKEKKPTDQQLDLLGGVEDARPASPSPDEEPLPDKFPYIVVIIDELADLMQTTPADVESAIARLSAKARAAGIHLVIATQTPRASVITGVIKTNVPGRIAFQVPSALDSRVILDENGAENLLGKGDMLYLRPGSSKMIRAQGAFVSEEEVARVVEFIAKQARPTYEVEIHEKLSRDDVDEEEISDKDEELIEKCLEVIRQEKRASTSLLQRRLKIGYGRGAWVMDQLEKRGIVGPKDGARDREILVDLDQLDDLDNSPKIE